MVRKSFFLFLTFFFLGLHVFSEGDNYALKFTENGQYVQMERDRPDPPWTVEMWVNRYASRDYSTLMNGSVSKIMLESWNNGQRIGLTRKWVADWAFNYVLPLNTWVHVALVCDGTVTRLYVNGEKKDEMAHVAPMPEYSLGMAAETPFATVDEVRLWKVARTAEEIATYWNRSVDPTSEGLIGYYYFDDREDPAIDLSPAAVAGELHGPVYVENDNPDFTTTLERMELAQVAVENRNEYFVRPGSRGEDLLCIDLNTTGYTQRLQVTSFTVTLAGSTTVTAVDSLWMVNSGSQPLPGEGEVFAGKVTGKEGEIVFTGSATLLPGHNYFWLMMDVSAAATPGSLIDATLERVVVDDETVVPAVTAPPGSRQVELSIPRQPVNRAAVIPLPVSMQIDTSRRFVLTEATRIVVDDSSRAEGEKAAAFLRRATSYPLPVVNGTAGKEDLAFVRLTSYEDSLGEEGYRLTVDDDGVRLEANTDAGLFYGFQTLRQLLPAAVEDSSVAGMRWDIPYVRITDRPRYSWRGMHLDVSRHFFGVPFIKEYLDIMAMFKLNRFHWHLTDDQGWRLEIKSRPKLQSIAAWRTCNGVRYGGYYTQEQVREIIRYADSLHIMIIPEIEMPGHTVEVLAAYPELSCTTDTSDYGGPFSVRCGPGVTADIFCAGKEATFDFIEDVLDEVTELFPGPYVHLGGDEAVKTRWAQCRDCQARIAAEGLSNETELQRWFMERVGRYLEGKGKKWIGWSEITWGGVPENATVMSWLGEGAAVAAARAGHDAILSPNDYLYLNKPNTDLPEEPLGQGKVPITLQQVYFYDPMPSGLTVEQQEHILGPHGCLWTEFIAEKDHAEYMLLPRLTALAEIGWTALSNDYQGFLERLYPLYDRFARLGYHPRMLVFPDGLLPDRIIACKGDSVVLDVHVPATSYYWNDADHTSGASLVVRTSGIWKCYVDYLGEVHEVRSEVLFRSTDEPPEVDTAGNSWLATGQADTWLWYDAQGELVARGDTFVPAEGTTTADYSISGLNLVSKKGAVHIGGDTYVRLRQSDFLNDAPAFTFEGWFLIHNYRDNDRLLSKTLTNSNRITIELYNGRFRFAVSRAVNSYGLTQAGTVPVDEWHHLAFVFNGAGQDNEERMQVYMDGKPLSLTFTGTLPEMTTNSPMPLTMGDPDHNPEMAFTSVRFWERALTGDEIRLHMDMRSKGDEEGLVYYLPAEGSGPELVNLSQNNSYTAYIVNMSDDARWEGYTGVMQYGCESARWPVSSVATALRTPHLPGLFSVSPNPSGGSFRLQATLTGDGPAVLSLYSLYGSLLKQYVLPSGAAIDRMIVLPPLPAGAYLLELSQKGRSMRKIIIKN